MLIILLRPVLVLALCIRYKVSYAYLRISIAEDRSARKVGKSMDIKGLEVANLPSSTV